MKTILLSLALLISTSALAKLNLVKVSRSIVIDEKSSTVYEVFANTLNDHLWRDEVNSIVADGPFEVGTNYTEDAHIALKKNFITKVQLVELIDQELALYKTPEDAPFFLSSKRKVEQLSDGKTRATYTVEFDYEMTRHTAYFPIPKKIVWFAYDQIMKKYLLNLKSHFE
ncbi:MAG: hypothetical protein CME64_10100 [Halobacteriovoraceae bacterium]|nr:hypothetical protein [Halobacteriovoraceae bacterium]|tara:strand:- start:107808 stop:108317 length:510 start_codon:yes stop_codon:yes gene_type:complete